SADVAETTILADTIKQKVPGQVDPGELNFEIAYDPTYTDTTTILAQVKTAVPNYTQCNFQLSYPAVAANTSNTKTFLGFFTKIGLAHKKKELSVAPVTITASGGSNTTPLG